MHQCNSYCIPQESIHGILGIASSEANMTKEIVKEDLRWCCINGREVKEILSLRIAEVNVEDWVKKAEDEHWNGNKNATSIPMIVIVRVAGFAYLNTANKGE